MQLLNSWGQRGPHRAFRADGTITTGNTPQLLLPERQSTSMLLVMNISSAAMYLEIGSARATATLTNGAVSSCALTNGGFGFTVPPNIQFLGGAGGGRINVTSTLGGAGVPGQDAPGTYAVGRPAQAHAVLSGGVVNSIVMDDEGSGYQWPPYVLITNNQSDPFGCANPYFGSAYSGIVLQAGGGSYYMNGTACPTDPIAIVSGTSTSAFTVKWMQ